MIDITVLQGIWFVLIAVLMAGYFILDGFDLGIGVLYPFIGKDEEEKALLRRSVGPVWDGNEVWILTAGGALFAAFAPAYATSFSGFYLAIMLVLFGLIMRAVSFEFRAHDPGFKKLWDAFLFIGSLLPALLLGVAVGNIVGGIELDPAGTGNYIGGFFALLDPFSLCCGLVGLCTMMTLGASWVTVKMQPYTRLYSRAKLLKPIFAGITIVLLVVTTILYFALGVPAYKMVLPGLPDALAWVCFIVVIVALGGGLILGGSNDLGGHIVLSIACAGLVGLAAVTIFPCIIPATEPALSLFIATASSSELTLMVMLIITVIFLPLVLIYHVLVYRAFRGKVGPEDIKH